MRTGAAPALGNGEALRAETAPLAVLAWLGHLVKGRVERFHLPGMDAMNLVLHEALDGGGPISQRLDPLGKGMGQILLDMPVALTPAIAAELAEIEHTSGKANTVR